MLNDMTCNTTSGTNFLFPCEANLTGIPVDGADFFVRCQDQKGNNMTESLKYSLHGSTALIMRNLQPDGSEMIYGAVSPAPVELYAETSMGCYDGVAVCEYKTDSGKYTEFFDTNNADGVHTQRLDLAEGPHEVSIRCTDAGGNQEEKTISFNVEINEEAPIVARFYEEDGNLKIVTVTDSNCVYSSDDEVGCEFEFDEGTVMHYADSKVHIAEWSNDKTFYIKCRDDFRNEEADNCSITIRPTTDFL